MLRRILLTIFLVLFLPSILYAKTAVVTFSALTGGGTGALDAIECEDIRGDDSNRAIANGDIAFGVGSFAGISYVYNSSGSDGESSPTIIVPDDRAADCSGNGQWEVSTPNDNTAGNVSTTSHGLMPKLPNDATKIIDGTGSYVDIEDLADEIAAGIAEGELADSVVVGADVKDGTLTYADGTGSAKSLTPVIDDPDNFASNFTGENLYGGTFIANAAGTAALPAVAAGMNFTYVLEGANANVIDPDGTGTADTIYMNGLAAAQDENLESSTSGAICVFQYRAADTWMATCNDFAEASPP
jgi:hypothetical protein